MTEQLSLWGLIVNASLLVQFVMLLLFFASVISWAMIIQRGLYLRNAAHNLRQFEDDFWSGVDLNQLYDDIRGRDGGEGIVSVFRAGFREFSKLSQQADVEPDAVMEGAERSMRVALSREGEKLNQHLPFLASVASVSPYIGLFGTVWGIMNSFRGLPNVHQATLAVVAPGISEALIATAMGLFAAIPAVLAYNRYSSAADTIFNSYETFAEELSIILHRRIYSK
jgi:biopolymer transport protein TolQ